MSEKTGHYPLNDGELTQKSNNYMGAIESLRYLDDEEISSIVKDINQLNSELIEKVGKKLEKMGDPTKP
jgi:hypothetical protein